MSADHLDKLKQLKAEYEADHADVEANLAQLEQQRNGLERKRDELRQLIEGVDGVLSSITGRNAYPRTAGVVVPKAGHGNSPTSLQDSTPTTNGLPKNPNRRQMVLQILPRFHGETFEASDIRERLVEDYLEGDEPPNFPQAINNLLKRMADKGEIELVGKKGEKRTDPWVYRAKNQEETLNLGP